MSKKRLVTIIGAICVVVLAVTTLPVTKAGSSCGNGQKREACTKKAVATETLSLEKIHSGHLPMLSQSLNKAVKAIEAGDKETALAELNKAQKMLAAIKEGIAKRVKPKFANASCPIMGSPINPKKVTKNLIRDHEGQKIAFCCGGCPSAWDKLSDKEKDAKLAKAKP